MLGLCLVRFSWGFVEYVEVLFSLLGLSLVPLPPGSLCKQPQAPCGGPHGAGAPPRPRGRSPGSGNKVGPIQKHEIAKNKHVYKLIYIYIYLYTYIYLYVYLSLSLDIYIYVYVYIYIYMSICVHIIQELFLHMSGRFATLAWLRTYFSMQSAIRVLLSDNNLASPSRGLAAGSFFSFWTPRPHSFEMSDLVSICQSSSIFILNINDKCSGRCLTSVATFVEYVGALFSTL